MKKEIILTDYLYKNEKKYAEMVYLRQPINGQYHDFTWSETMLQARKIANFLKQQGCKKGDRIGILSKNCAEWFITDFAIMMAGLISVPLFSGQHKDIIEYVLDHAEVKLIFVGKLDNWAIQEPGIPKDIIRVAFPYENTMPANYRWNDILKEYSPLTDNHHPDVDDIYSILYTSGTTGNPKGVIYTFRNVANFCKYYKDEVAKGYYSIPERGRFISYLPLAHCMERLGVEIGSLIFHTSVSFVESLNTFAKNLEDTSPDAFIAVPRLWVQFQLGMLHKVPQQTLDFLLKIPLVSSLVKKKIKKSLGLSRARLIISGSAPLSQAILAWFRKLDIEILEGYGLTENLIWGSFNRHKNKDGTVGLVREGSEIKIGKDGEILIKSDVMMAGYYKDPKATKAAFTKDGFLHTGDKGFIDDEGYLTIYGRVNDSFKTDKGEFVEPIHIEKKFARNTNIEQLCLIGLYLPQPVMIVSLSDAARERPREKVTKELQITLDEINKNLTKFERISLVFVVKDHWLPENLMATPTLKIRREEIAKHYLDQVKAPLTKEEQIIWE